MLRELAGVFALCLGSLLSLILIGRVLHMRELFLSLDLGLWDFLRLFGYLSPFFLLLLIPIACMLAVFLTFLRMSTDRELVALKAGGLSLYRLLPAPVIFCLACSLACLGVSLYGLSWGMDHFRAEVMELARTKTQLVIQPGVFNRDFPGLTVFARQADNARGVLGDIMVRDETRPGITATILAPEGVVRTDSDEGRIYFELRNGRIYRREGERMSVLGFGSYFVNLNLDRLLGKNRFKKAKPKEMSWTDLRHLENDPKARKKDKGNYLRKIIVEQHKRWALPLACLALGLFAVPVACAFEGLRQQWGFILAMGMFLGYYVLFSLGLTTGEAGVLPPAVGLWLPNAVFLALAGIGIRLAARERGLRIVDRLMNLRLKRGKAAEDAG